MRGWFLDGTNLCNPCRFGHVSSPHVGVIIACDFISSCRRRSRSFLYTRCCAFFDIFYTTHAQILHTHKSAHSKQRSARARAFCLHCNRPSRVVQQMCYNILHKYAIRMVYLLSQSQRASEFVCSVWCLCIAAIYMRLYVCVTYLLT